MANSDASNLWLKPIRNAGVVGAGKAAQGIMSLGYMAFAARALGPKEFGFLVLIHAFVFGLSQILRLQTWQAVLRYGAVSVQKKDNAGLAKLIHFCGCLDVYAALFGLIVIQIAMKPAAELFELSTEALPYARVYGIAIVFMILNPTQLGILRLFDRFSWIALQTTVEAVIRLVGGFVLFLLSGTLTQFLILWMSACVVSRIVLMVMARHALRLEGFEKNEKRPFFVHPLKAPEEGMWAFIFSHNLARSVVAAQPHLALFLVGALLGPAAAGLFRIAQQFSDVLVKPSNKFLVPAIYPELAKFQAGENTFARRDVVKKNVGFVSAIAFGIFVFLVLAGPWLIAALVGSEYRAAYAPMIILSVAGLITTLSFPLEPLLSAAGRMKAMIIAYALGLMVYVFGLYILTLHYGLVGAGFAAALAALVSAAMMFAFGRDLLKKEVRND